MELRLTAGGTVLRATMPDSGTTRDFTTLLPLTVTLSDYAQTEKVSELPRRLSTTGAPEGHDPDVGDIAYYEPWGNLAIYYRDFVYSSGLVKLGSIDSGVEELATLSGDFAVTIELADAPPDLVPFWPGQEDEASGRSISAICLRHGSTGCRHSRQLRMEPLWSPVVATGGNRSQIRSA